MGMEVVMMDEYQKQSWACRAGLAVAGDGHPNMKPARRGGGGTMTTPENEE